VCRLFIIDGRQADHSPKLIQSCQIYIATRPRSMNDMGFYAVSVVRRICERQTSIHG
jgi:hypothetical protein